MRRLLRWTGRIVAALVALPLLLALLAGLAANTQPGRAWIEQALPRLTDGEVALTGLSGRFPDALRARHIALSDTAGPWLSIDNLSLDWSPTRLLTGIAEIDRLEAERIAMARQRVPEEPESSGTSLPVQVDLRGLRVGRMDLAQPVLGTAAALAVEGKGRLATLDQGEAELSILRLDGEGEYTVRGRIEAGRLQAKIDAQEPALGLLASLSGLPELGALDLAADLDGPYSALATRLALTAGPLRVSAQGTLDLDQNTAEMAVTATAPAMRPRPGLSWQSVALDAKAHGPLDRPTVQAALRVAGLGAAETRIPETTVDLRGDLGQLSLRATLAGVRIPGPRPDLLRAAPLSVEAKVRLDAPDRPVTFALRHPLLSVEGQAATQGELRGKAELKLPDLAPLAAVGGVDARGSALASLRVSLKDDAVRIDSDGKLAVTGGRAPLPALAGGAARFGASAELRGADLKLSRFQFDGKALNLSASGGVSAQAIGLDWKLALSDVAAVAPKLSGRVSLAGRLAGPAENFAVAADLNGELAAPGLPRGAVSGKLELQGLPRAPAGPLTAQGAVFGAPLRLAVDARRDPDGALRVAIDRADWKSAHAEGALTLPEGAALPVGKIDLRMARLDDLQALLGSPLQGSLAAVLETMPREARLRLDARGLAVGGAAVGQAALAVAVADPTGRPWVDGNLALDGLAAGSINGSARINAAGPLAALDLGLTAGLRNLGGADARLSGTARLDLENRTVAVSDFEAHWQRETLRLLEPARIDFGDGLAVDRLRLGLRKAVLEVAGRAAPSLDLEADLRGVSADLADLAVPGLNLEGTLRAEARLSGAPARPVGSVTVEVAGLRPRSGPGRALPPLGLIANADLAGATARIDARLKSGAQATLTVAGEAPLAADGAFDLRANGALDLKLLDPLLMAGGRRVRGQLALNGGVIGTLAEPRPQGTAQWSGGEVQDFTQGLLLSDIGALLQAEGDVLRIARFQGRAGPGSVTLNGSLGPLAANPAVDLTLTARNARPLSSDRLTVDLNADLRLKGHAAGPLDAEGSVRLQRAEIRIPERLPANIAVLDVRKPGAPPPPPPRPGPEIGLNLTVSAPGEIFVRGRGLDAELGGTVHLRGTAANPRPEGGFELRRGEFSLAGKALVFSKGVVGFDGGSLTDPSLDFAANTSSGDVTATLGIGGTARKPKITLSSVPESPPDEILAQLLFGRATASLSAFEMVQIGTAVASLTGIAPGLGGGNTLDSVRKTLGLDRLAIGGGPGGGPALEAGRYVAPGVFVGAKQGISGSGTQGMVQIDVAKGLKVEGSVGTGSSSANTTGANATTNSVGVIYQIEY
jgi:translocation and assembly module TamB